VPRTNGHGNPDWTREETILALELLYRHKKPLDKRHPEILALSNLLRSAPFHPESKRKANFRNSDGVALKLQNLFSALEPGRGLSSSQMDRLIITDYPRQREAELQIAAEAIRQSLVQNPIIGDIDEEEEFIEGARLTRRHLTRERNKSIRKKLMAKLTDDTLVCEVCGFSPPPLSRQLRESFFEAHHILPLAEAEKARSTLLKDIALLCAGCHRFLHKLIRDRKQWVGSEDARQIIKGSKPT
jgi:5-methylcytosine-specific restriction protein A